MKCYVSDCQNETHHRCSFCGEPVCWQHGEPRFAYSLYTIQNIVAPYPMMRVTGEERVCSQGENKLQEESKHASGEIQRVV